MSNEHKNIHVDDKLYGVKISRHRTTYVCSDPETLYSRCDLPFKVYMKWKWFFTYLAAKYQIETPRNFIEVRPLQEPNLTNQKAIEAKRIQDKIMAAKRNLTRLNNRFEVVKKIFNTQLFGIETHPELEKFEERRQYYLCRIKELENELLKSE